MTAAVHRSLIATGRLSNLHPYVAQRVRDDYWYHRGPWMERVLENIEVFFHETLGGSYRIVTVTATALGGKEALITNLVTPGDTVWTSSLGDFARVASVFAGRVEAFDEPRRSPPGGAPAAVFLEHLTDSGRLTRLEALSQSVHVRHPGVPVIADLSASFGSDLESAAPFGLDAVLIAPERALGGIPGLCVIAMTDELLARMRALRSRMQRIPFVFDLLKYEVGARSYSTPYSPDISAAVALDASLRLIRESGGLPAHTRRHAAWAKAVRAYCSRAGLRVRTAVPLTNAFTCAAVPSAPTVADALARKNVFVGLTLDGELRIGHTGHLTEKQLGRLFRALDEVLGLDVRPTRIDGGPSVQDPSGPVATEIFAIDPSEFAAKAIRKAQGKRASVTYERRIVHAADAVFNWSRDFRDHSAYQDRTVGFFGAGNVAREAVARCQVIGVKDIVVYSPSLAAEMARARARHQSAGVTYWLERGVGIVRTPADLFLASHTVVLVPTLHTRQSVRLLGKTAAHRNEGVVSAALLSRIEKTGVMDLLVNASARGDLVDKAALAVHLERGWLSYMSDELPGPGDPVLRRDNAYFTGHVGGSCAVTQTRVAENTHLILRRVLSQLTRGGELERCVAGYRLNVVNEHLRRSPWRSTRGLGDDRQIRILITDPFDVSALDFPSLERLLGIQLTTLDVSSRGVSERELLRKIRTFRPHVIMLRARTKVTRQVAIEATRSSPLAAVIRSGVGVDNLYGGMRELSRAGVLIVNEPVGNSSAVAEMTMHFILRGSERVLLTPGPSIYKPEVFHVLDCYVPPESKAFARVERTIRDGLEPWIGAGGETALVSGPATALMEAAIVNLTEPDSRGLVIAHGKFVDRFAQIARQHQRNVVTLAKEEREWGSAFHPRDVAAHFRSEASRHPAHRLAFLCLQQNETSSAVAYRQRDLEAIARAARAHNPDIMILVDAVSGVFAHDLDFTCMGADMVILGSQKRLGVSSGYSFGALSARAVRVMLGRAGYRHGVRAFVADRSARDYVRSFGERQGVYYLNLLRLLLEGRQGRTDTASVFHALSTAASLALRDAAGRQSVLRRQRRLAALARSLANRAPFSTLSEWPSDSVTAIVLPPDASAKAARVELERVWGMLVSGAQSDFWKPRLVRIGHMGYVDATHIVRCMRALRQLVTRQS